MILSPVTIWKKFDLTQALNAETEAETLTPAGFVAQNVRLDGHLLADGGRVKIFARFTKPHGSEAAPALLLLPDADDDGAELADYFAAKGYATLIPDYCGRRGGKGTGKVTKSDTAANEADAAKEEEIAAEAKKITAEENTDGGKKNYTVYPEAADYANYEVSGAPAYLESESVENSAWMEWAYVALYALEYLKTRSDVSKIGVSGVRLGGEIAWMITLSPDISCAVIVNAAGWRSHLSAPKWGAASAAGEESQDGDNYILKDDTKEFIVNPKTGQYSLNCNTQKEYPVPKPYGADWLHFITIQNVSDISRISEMENIWMDLDFSIPYCENLMSEADFNMDLHTALFQWVFVVKNCNPDSFDYNQYFWMNIPLYDGRSLSDESWKTFKESAFLDYGKEDKSNTFIYMAPSDGYLTEEGVEVGKRYHITLDLIPYLEKALTTIQQLDENKNSDFPLLLNTTMDDLCINQFYIGWEVPGTFNCGATIYKNSLLYNKI